MNEYRNLANQLLDRAKDGEEFSRLDIDRALRDAGDLAPVRSQGMDQALPQEGQGRGESRSIRLVAENLLNLSQKTWASRP